MKSNAKRRMLATGAAGAVIAGMFVAPAATAAPIEVDPAKTAVVNLLHFNDFHGRLDSETTPLFAATIEELRAEYPNQTLLTAAGDSIGATNFVSSVQEDNPTIDVLNAIDLDASSAGNHEFDRGADDLTGRVTDRAEFPYLMANVTRGGEPIGKTYELFEVDGVTVAVIGAVTEQTPQLVDRGGIEGLEFGDPVEAINEVAETLEGKADVIVAEMHEGSGENLEPDASQAEQEAVLGPDSDADGPFNDIVNGLSPEIDAIFNGHTQRSYSWLAPVPGDDTKKRPVLQSNEYSNLVGQVVLTVDRATGEVNVDPENVGNHERISAGEGGDTAALIDSYAQKYPRVAEVRDIVAEAEDQAEVAGNVQIGSITGPLTLPGESNSNRGEESTMAQVMANVFRDQLASEDRGGADIGIVNPGGVRDSLQFEATPPEEENGIVRLSEANAVTPFVNNMWTGTFTGAQLKQILEEQWQRDESGAPIVSGRPYLQLGLSDNVTYIADPLGPLDNRISDIRIDGVPVTADQEIRVGSASFLFGPGDNFWTMGEGSDVRDSGLVDFDLMVAYFGDNPGLAPDYSQRHVQVTRETDDPVNEGEEFEIAIANIDRVRSTGAPISTVVEIVDAAGTVVGTGDVVVVNDEEGAPLASGAQVVVTPTIVEQTDPAPDLQGAGASADGVRMLAAAAAAGEPVWQTLTIRNASGTEIPFQIQVIPAQAPVPTEPAPSPTDPAPTDPAPSDPAKQTPGAGAPGGKLPNTGAEVSSALWVGGALLLLGVAIFVMARLRRR